MSATFTRNALFLICLVLPMLGHALTAHEFNNICKANKSECHEVPLIQAYIGGALDLLATLNEQTEYLDTLYCREPTALFNIPSIVNYMQTNQSDYASRNTMIVLVRYFEEHGGCSDEK